MMYNIWKQALIFINIADTDWIHVFKTCLDINML